MQLPGHQDHPETDGVRFILDGEVVTVRNCSPATAVLNYLREQVHRTGTKEGCAEGDCGACTVVLADLDPQDRLRYRAINACIRFLPTIDGKALFTVESLKGANGELHPVQQAMMDCHASQCGFCTPGFVMSLFALYKSEPPPTPARASEALAGNLCRCTGYRPILAAAQKMYACAPQASGDVFGLHQPFAAAAAHPGEVYLREQLRRIRRKTAQVIQVEGGRYFAPQTTEELSTLKETYPEAYLLAGGTDIGLWVTKQHRDLDPLIYLGNVPELAQVTRSATHLTVGAAVALSDAFAELESHYPELSDLFSRFASPPIRNSGTLVGNIANGSPIGDSMPALIALGATLVLRKGQAQRELPLDEFYLAYQKKAWAPGEWIECVRIPLPAPGRILRSYKISKRFDQDISAVCGAYCLALADGCVQDIRICYGGMAATSKRAAQTEAALIGRPWRQETIDAAAIHLESDYTPLTDMRASSDYRRRVAKNLLQRFFLETSGETAPISVLSLVR